VATSQVVGHVQPVLKSSFEPQRHRCGDWYEAVGISWPCRWRSSGGCGVLRRTEPI